MNDTRTFPNRRPSRVDLYLAYRQAKGSFWSEERGIDLVDLARYEANLVRNLSRLRSRIGDGANWFDRVDIGRAYLSPKVLRPIENDNDSVVHIGSVRPPASADLAVRLHLAPTPDFTIIEVLYLWAFGDLLDGIGAPESVGYRLDIPRGRHAVSRTKRNLFQYWPTRYRAFRTAVVAVAAKTLRQHNNTGSCTLASVDLASFYDSVDPTFLRTDSFVDDLVQRARATHRPFDRVQYMLATNSLLMAYERFRRSAKSLLGFPIGRGVPIGSILSRVVANAALTTLDRHIASRPNVLCYRRYVDDMLIVGPTSSDGTTRGALKRWLPLVDNDTGMMTLDTQRLGRDGSAFDLQNDKVRVYSLDGVEGLDFLEAVTADIARLSSEGRAFADVTLLRRRGKLALVRPIGSGGTRLN